MDMKLKQLSILTFVLSFFASNVSAQNLRTDHWCATDQNYEEMKQNDPSFAQAREALEAYTLAYAQTRNASKKKATVIIPVVVHNITHDGGQGYVSKSVIEAQINRLNIDFNRQNNDTVDTRSIFKPFAGSVDVEFRLAHIDPNGNCTEGIVRMENDLSLYPVPRNSVKSVSYWPNSGARKYFNIWIIDEIESNTDGSYVAGYAQFPGSNDNGTYGVVMVDQNIGFNERTLTHELGHCLNLYHTFNYFSNDCSNPNDYCSDTPRQDQAYTSACNETQNSCSNSEADYGSVDVVDQIENYMSYSSCQNMFTLDQKVRIESILINTTVNSGVGGLATAANLMATGVADPYNPAVCTPVADFKYGVQGQQLDQKSVYICTGDSVSFVDYSYDATPTLFDWIFTGGSPSTSAIDNPTISYETAGVFSVTHQPGTSAGNGNETKTNIITVSSLSADYTGIIVDGFENSTAFTNEWRIENIDEGSQPFNRITTSAATGSASVRILNRFISEDGELHELISPSYDLSSLGDPTLNFKWAFARMSSADSDRLLVWYSLDCGSSWTLALAPMQGSVLSTIGTSFNTANWIPGSADWETKTGSLSGITDQANVRFKFSFESGGGNNLYIDDINIDGTLSVGEAFQNVQGFKVFPNPTSASAKVSFKLAKEVKKLSIVVRNAVGQVVTSVVNGQSFNAGNYTLNVDQDKKLSSGLYFISFNADDETQVQKLVVR
jgi:hypothetical protein